jgi:hypothetical protein
VELQYQIYAGLLFLSALLNIRRLDMLALIAVTALYLIIFPAALAALYPTEVPDTVYWYGLMAIVEFSFLISALSLCCGAASYLVATLSGWNIVAHGLGAWAYLHNGPFYDIYPIALTSGEICQVLATIVLSKPIMLLIEKAATRFKRSRCKSGRKRYQFSPRPI